MTAAIGRRTALLLALIGQLRRAGAAAPEPGPGALPLVTGTLGEAKSSAEGAVHVVNQFGSDKPAVLVGAMQSYSRARAAYNRLIESLMTERDPDSAAISIQYQEQLDQARRAQENFLKFVQENVVDTLPKGGKAPLSDVFADIGHLFDGLSNLGNSAVSLHKEYTRESEARRTEIHQQLEGLKWQQFSTMK